MRDLDHGGTRLVSGAGSNWLDSLPLENDRRLTDVFGSTTSFASARTAVARVFELHDRAADAVRFARAEIADELVHNGPSRIHAGLVLGRCHAKQGQHSL